jgi:hypothetical protein
MPMLSTDYAHSMQLSPDWLAQADHLHLGIHIHSEGLLIGLFEMRSKQPIWLMDTPILPHHIAQALQQGQWVQPFFRKVSISFSAETWTVVPQSFFNPDNLSIWVEETANAQLGYQNLQQESNVLIHRHGKDIEQIAVLYPQAQVNCAIKMWLQLSPPSDHENALIAWIESDKLCIQLIQNHQRILLNQFDAKSAEDVLYFISASLQQHPTSPETEILMMGQGVSEELLETLSHYYVNIKVWNTPLGLQLPESCTLPAHYYYSILMHTLCA